MPLPENFYPPESWLNNLLTFYSNNNAMPAREVLEAPLADMVDATHTMCVCYANFDNDLVEFLDVISNPLMPIDRFTTEVADKVRAGAEETGEAGYTDMADAMLLLRQLFERNTTMLTERYGPMLEQTNTPAETLAEALRTIVKVHTTQVADLVRNAQTQ